ncbi:MAG: hypothetical protein K1000chlam2_00101 [Chlamydiae bacterium]|nr:hypothetical protein [Chlamydiota bacterium]
MQKIITKYSIFYLCLALWILPKTTYSSEISAQEQLYTQYEYFCRTPSDIQGHIPVLRGLAAECSSVVEIGLRGMISTWGILQGLSESMASSRTYIGIDIASPSLENLQLAKELATTNGISFFFWKKNNLKVKISPVEMLFIDSLHTYCHLTYELEKFSPKISKFIVMHDTSAPWGDADDTQYQGDYSEYPSFIDRSKRGLWAAVEDFLTRHPEWMLYERRFNHHGLTILKRI